MRSATDKVTLDPDEKERIDKTYKAIRFNLIRGKIRGKFAKQEVKSLAEALDQMKEVQDRFEES